MPHITSAVVYFLTAGVEVDRENRTVFSARHHNNGTLALGLYLQKYIILVREGSPFLSTILLIMMQLDGQSERLQNWMYKGSIFPPPNYTKTHKQYSIKVSECKCVLIKDLNTI